MSRSAWGIGVPIAIVALGLVIWALLAGMPFGGDRSEGPRRDAPAMETVGEGTAPEGSSSRELLPPDDEQAVDAPAATTATSSRATTPAAAPAARAPRSVPIPPPSATREPVRESSEAAAPRREPAAREQREQQPQGEITQPQAEATLRGYIASRAELGVSGDCLAVSPVEYKNRGYTMSAADRCDEKALGRWRVDSVTREVFRQQSDGRFLRP